MFAPWNLKLDLAKGLSHVYFTTLRATNVRSLFTEAAVAMETTLTPLMSVYSNAVSCYGLLYVNTGCGSVLVA